MAAMYKYLPYVSKDSYALSGRVSLEAWDNEGLTVSLSALDVSTLSAGFENFKHAPNGETLTLNDYVLARISSTCSVIYTRKGGKQSKHPVAKISDKRIERILERSGNPAKVMGTCVFTKNNRQVSLLN